MKVPTVEQSVGSEVPNVQPVQVPGAVSGAFGEKEAEAITGLGQTISGAGDKFGQIALIKQKQQNEVHIANLENQAIDQFQSILHNPDPNAVKTVKIGGKDTDVPDGLKDRFLNQAHGITQEWDQRSSDIINSTLSQVKNPYYQSVLANRLHASRLSGREQVIDHEVTQIRKADESTYDATVRNNINQAADISDPVLLQGVFKNITDLETAKANRLGVGEMEKNNAIEKDIRMAAEKAAETMLYNTRDIDKAKQLFSTASPYVTGDNYTESLLKLDSLNTTLERTDRRALAIKKEDLNNTINDKLAKHTLTLEDMDQIAQIPESQGGLPQKMVKEYYKVVQDGIKGDLEYMAKEKLGTAPGARLTQNAQQVRQYMDLIYKYMDNETDAWKAREYLATAYKDGIIDPKTEGPILNKLKSTLENEEFNRKTQYFKGPIAALIQHFKGFNASDQVVASNLKALIKQMGSGVAPDIALQKVITDYNKYTRPDILTHPQEGRLMIDKYGTKAIVFPDGTVKPVQAKQSAPQEEKKEPKPKEENAGL